MKKKIIDMGIVSAIFDYSIDGDTAVIHELWLGGAEAVKFPLTDWYDVKNFSELLSKEIGMSVTVEGESA